MAKFNKGDRVLVNGSQVATIHTYEEEDGRLVLDAGVEGGGEHLIYGPISSYRLQHLVTPAVGVDPEEDAEVDDEEGTEGDGPKDQFTTLESL